MKYRWEVINWLIEKRGYKTYLEIGVKDGYCYDRVKLDGEWLKVGVDPNPLVEGMNSKTSDEFFAAKDGKIYDIIFIDGDHHEKQVLRDIKNSLLVLHPKGTIVMHDCNPKKEIFATPERGENQPLWSGTAYRAYLTYRAKDPCLSMFVVDVDWGCGVIAFDGQKVLDLPDDYDWDDFDKNRVDWLNLISAEEFMRRVQ